MGPPGKMYCARLALNHQCIAGDPDAWERMMAINLKAPMRLTRALAPGMVDKVGPSAHAAHHAAC